MITRQGCQEAVLVSSEEWERLAKAPSFADLLLAFPGGSGDVPVRRRKPARALHDAAL
ncbi:hypothetical protein [Methylocystis parvus]|uniref:hypothetical protein n=1 Tax=Methylocystis parvus TaxID=134 RepID=UPI0002D7DAE4